MFGGSDLMCPDANTLTAFVELRSIGLHFVHHSGHCWPARRRQENIGFGRPNMFCMLQPWWLQHICYLDMHRSHNAAPQIWYTMKRLQQSVFVSIQLHQPDYSFTWGRRSSPLKQDAELLSILICILSIFICMWDRLHTLEQEVCKVFLTVLPG